MKIVCAWCRNIIRHGDDLRASHGICAACRETFATHDAVSLQRFIDTFDFPVIVLNEALKPIAVNRKGSAICTPVEPNSTLGEVVQGAHSRLPESCGNTVHCSGCTIRRTLTETAKTGQGFTHIPATVSRISSDVALLITTIRTDTSAVLLKIERTASAKRIATTEENPHPRMWVSYFSSDYQ